MMMSHCYFSILLFLTAFFSVRIYAASEGIDLIINQKLSQLPSLLQEDPTGKKSQKLLKTDTLLYPIQNYFYQVSGSLLEHSRERQSRVLEVEALLQPYEKSLVELTRATLNSGNRDTSSIRLLAFFPATPDVKNALLSITQEPLIYRAVVDQAYETFFMLQMDDPKFRGDLVDFIKTNRNQKTTASEVATGLYSASVRWGVPEMEEIYVQDIQTPIHTKNYVYGNNRLALIGNIINAARGLDYYGKMSENYVEALKARVRELDLSSGDEQNALSQFEKTIAIMKGEKEPEFTVSWKGQLLGVSNETYRKWFGHDREIKEAAAFDRRPRNEVVKSTDQSRPPVLVAPSTTLIPQSVTGQATPSTPFLPWVVGLLLLAVFGGVWWKFLRK
jgi:hypothetical protein